MWGMYHRARGLRWLGVTHRYWWCTALQAHAFWGKARVAGPPGPLCGNHDLGGGGGGGFCDGGRGGGIQYLGLGVERGGEEGRGLGLASWVGQGAQCCYGASHAAPSPPHGHPRQGCAEGVVGGGAGGLQPKSSCTKNGPTRFSMCRFRFSRQWPRGLGEGEGEGEGEGGRGGRGDAGMRGGGEGGEGGEHPCQRKVQQRPTPRLS